MALIIFMTGLKLSASIIRLKKSEEKDEAQKEFEEYYGGNAVTPVWVSVPGDFASMENVKKPMAAFRLMIGGMAAWNFAAGFILFVIAIGPYFFPKLTDYIVLISGICPFIGCLTCFLSDRRIRRIMLSYSITGMGVITLLFIIAGTL